jgi:hypothetical protein
VNYAPENCAVRASETGAGITRRKLNRPRHLISQKYRVCPIILSVGTDAYNMELSERRAETIREALVARGVDTTRVVTKGYGKTYLVADNSSTDGRAVNRRVEVVIADENGNLRGRGT